MTPQPRVLRHRSGILAWGERTLVMGIVNVTPDSFSDGGVHAKAEDAVRGSLEMAAEGADILDLGAESTRPGHQGVSPEQEWVRLGPVFEGLSRSEAPLPPISVDTSKAEVARRALAAGASIVNDVWGFQRDPAIAAAAAEHGAAAVLMHNRDAIDARIDIVSDILAFLERSVGIATRAGLSENRIVLDPGIGFGKSPRQQLEAIRGIPKLKALGFPVLLGVSRKSFIGKLAGGETAPAERLPGTIAANVVGIGHGADIVRVHDVGAHVKAMRVVDALRSAT